MVADLLYSATSFIRNLDYPDLLVYAYTEGMADDLLRVWRRLSDELDSSTTLSWPKLADQCTYTNAANYDHAVYSSFNGQVS